MYILLKAQIILKTNNTKKKIGIIKICQWKKITNLIQQIKVRYLLIKNIKDIDTCFESAQLI